MFIKEGVHRLIHIKSMLTFENENKKRFINFFILHTDFAQDSTQRGDSGFIYPSLHVIHLLFVLPDLMIIMIFSEIGL